MKALIDFTYSCPVMAEVFTYVLAVVGISVATKLGWLILKALCRGIRWVYKVYVYGL